MKFLILRLDAPMFSFGGVMIDQIGPTERFPGLSMLTGLMANALGWKHGDFEKLDSLQARLIYAARWDVEPQHIVEYQTVDLGQDKMRERGWTTLGVPEERKGGTASKGIHQRYRHYWADGLMTVALSLSGNEPPDILTIRQALSQPARPLFIGRKNCLPARPLLDPVSPVLEAESAIDAITKVPLWGRDGKPQKGTKRVETCWPVEESVHDMSLIKKVFDRREWASQLPAGYRYRLEGLVEVGDK